MTGSDAGLPGDDVWNFDIENRSAYLKTGAREIPPRRGFVPDTLTRKVIATVESSFPGTLRTFDWPAPLDQTRDALADLIRHRLVNFGGYQGAMWSAIPSSRHAQKSAAMNPRRPEPRKAIDAVPAAWRDAP